MKSKPLHPNTIRKNWGFRVLENSDFQELTESLTYWLIPRKTINITPEFPCIVWLEKEKTWEVFDDVWPELNTEEKIKEYATARSYWLPLPPSPEEQ